MASSVTRGQPHGRHSQAGASETPRVSPLPQRHPWQLADCIYPIQVIVWVAARGIPRQGLRTDPWNLIRLKPAKGVR